MATVVTPHAVSQAAMAARSQELAANLRTLAGKPSADAPAAGGTTRSAGTQTMCMSEWTSMPAAWELMTVSATACSRGGRDAGFGGGLVLLGLTGDDLTLAGVRWRRLMVSATFVRVGRRQPARAKRG